MWRGLEEWEQLTATLAVTAFDSIIAEEVEAQVQTFMKIAMQVRRA